MLGDDVGGARRRRRRRDEHAGVADDDQAVGDHPQGQSPLDGRGGPVAGLTDPEQMARLGERLLMALVSLVRRLEATPVAGITKPCDPLVPVGDEDHAVLSLPPRWPTIRLRPGQPRPRPPPLTACTTRPPSARAAAVRSGGGVRPAVARNVLRQCGGRMQPIDSDAGIHACGGQQPEAWTEDFNAGRARLRLNSSCRAWCAPVPIWHREDGESPPRAWGGLHCKVGSTPSDSRSRRSVLR